MNFHPIENSSDTARIIVPRLIEMYNPRSVIDLGCNVGWWLHWFGVHGVTELLGIDGSNMKEKLTIPPHQFLEHDLTLPLKIGWGAHLLLCLEVAEHLEEKHADVLVNTCVKYGDTIFWSAATPGQGGHHHVNEQPHQYWVDKFAAHGYLHRPLSNVLPAVPHDYYRKNAIEFKRQQP